MVLPTVFVNYIEIGTVRGEIKEEWLASPDASHSQF